VKELLRRLWREFWYDPLVEYQRAKDVLEKGLISSQTETGERRKSKLRLLNSKPPPKE
jgi:hypothetical protein